MSEFAGRLQTIDKTTLTPIVRQLVADDTAEVVTWTTEVMFGGYAGETVGGYGTYRVTAR